MASLGGEQKMSSNSPAGDVTKPPESREGSIERKAAKERDDKLKVARERQNEERQRKIEELKAQAEAAQRYREQKEEERRRRIEEIRHRDSEKRLQVEERKKAIMEAEKERREYILRKNQERESRLELKKRERNSYGYAFGSSTPRLLEPADFGMVSPSTFWGQRRSTSISNVAGASLSRRSSERELNDSGTKKRATSASGTERHDEDNVDTSQIVFRSVARRKTDLMPTIPSPRDGHYGSRSSLSTPRTPGSRSGNVTPGGQLTSRPGSSMSTSTTMSTSGFINRRSMPIARKPRPSSIAGTGVSLEEINKLKKENKPPMKTITPSTSAQTTPKRSTNMMSTSLIVTSSSRLSSAEKKTPNKREVAPKATTPKPLSKTSSTDRLHKINREKPKDLATSMTKSAIMSTQSNKTVPKDNKEPLTKSKEEKEALNQVKTEVLSNNHNTDTIKSSAQQNGAKERKMSGATAQEEEKTDQGTEKEPDLIVREKPKSHNGSKEGSLVREFGGGDTHDSMTASMIAKNKITTEEEAKAALAERRRWAREEAEKQAELERQRLEAERLAEIKRQEEETERQRQFEEEATRLAKEQREAEEKRLRQAIEEAKQREEEEKRKREEDEKQRLEREEAEKKAKEEAEKQKLVVAERLKREEKEREERRKRVEAIMSRTRRSGNNSTPSSTPSKENNNIIKPAAAAPNAATITPQENEEQLTPTHNATPAATVTSISLNSDSNSTSGSSSATATTPTAINNTVGIPVMPESTEQTAEENKSQFEPQNSQAMYEQSVIDKENSLINSFSNLIIDENVKNIHQQPQQQQQQRIHHQFVVEEKNAKKLVELQNNETKNILTTNAVANGNGHHIDSINNKNEIDLIQNVVPTANQLINLSLDTQDNVNFNNNNSLLTTTNTALVTADSHENKDISLL